LPSLATTLLPPASLLLLLFRDAHGKSAVNGVSSVANTPAAFSIPATVIFRDAPGKSAVNSVSFVGINTDASSIPAAVTFPSCSW
jgi:hypothetical protein